VTLSNTDTSVTPTVFKFFGLANDDPRHGRGTYLFFRISEFFVALSRNSKHNKNNEENSPTFDRRVSPLVGAATQESNVWVLSVKGRKKNK
jgi:hypothetical protein